MVEYDKYLQIVENRDKETFSNTYVETYVKNIWHSQGFCQMSREQQRNMNLFKVVSTSLLTKLGTKIVCKIFFA